MIESKRNRFAELLRRGRNKKCSYRRFKDKGWISRAHSELLKENESISKTSTQCSCKYVVFE